MRKADFEIMAQQILSFRDLRAYQKAFELQQLLFNISKSWPAEEKFALTGQIRRSSRSIGANIAEAWAKRKYPLHFVSKLSDSDGELQETSHWISTALSCNYITKKQQLEIQGEIDLIGGMLGKMMSKPESFIPKF